jgi:hypothetical protein
MCPRVCVHGSVSVCLCVCLCACLCLCICVTLCLCVPEWKYLCVSVCLGVLVCVCLCACVCLCVCVRVSVCYNNGKFREILRSAYPSGFKKELRVTKPVTYGFYVLQILLLTVSKCYIFFYLRFHSICIAVNK